MRFLFIGDVVGRPGKDAVLSYVPKLRDELRLDCVIVNCENVVHGRGVTPEVADELLRVADVLTGGNHIWHFKQINSYLERERRLIRPANYPNAPGRGSYVFRAKSGACLGVIQVEGRVFMRDLDCPFRAIERELDALGELKCVFVDLHCEATSEKQAIAWHFDGQVSALIGSHTHVPTADERILPGGTAYLTDAGMTGPYDSVIGMEPSSSIERFLTQRHTPHEVATGNVWLCGAVVEVDAQTGRAKSIERIKRVVG